MTQVLVTEIDKMNAANTVHGEYYILASCPWGPVTANGVDLLTEIYVI